ncbi:MAG TPA: ferritin-like domain-containing protein, partial [Thermodesulfobacteriota bacterium]|nr:ferritin-like domain-containing protein [Thermodesulfobacteriota bacterium]
GKSGSRQLAGSSKWGYEIGKYFKENVLEMSIRNPEKLKEVLLNPRRLARAFSRHTYGMLAWVDLFGAKLKSVKDLEMKLVVARIIADNTKHAKLFSDRARELGEKPETYKPPQIGQRIYDILEEYEDPFDDFAYAWGSLIHFSSLLDIYESVADSKSREVIKEVQRDVGEHLKILEKYFELNANTAEKKKRAEEIKMVADGIYADREDEEIKWYAS